MEDCFEGVICFETLNPSKEIVDNSNSLNTVNPCAQTTGNSLNSVKQCTETSDNEDESETVITSLGKADYSDTVETTTSDNSTNSKSTIL